MTDAGPDTPPAPDSGTPPGDLGSFDLIDSAEAAGTIDAETALTYRVFATFADPRLPAAYHGNDSGRFGIAILNTLRERFDTLAPAVQATLAPFLIPPAYRESFSHPAAYRERLDHGSRARPSCTSDADWSYAIGTTGTPRVRVWYERSGDTTAAFDLARALETEIWPRLTGLVGLEEPKSDLLDSCNGGSGALDVYLISMGFFSDYSAMDGSSPVGCRESAVYLLVNRGLAPDKLKAVTVHEFMHAIQAAYNTKSCLPAYGWLLDATANWAIDYVYPTSDVEHGYAPQYMDSPEKSVDDRIMKGGSGGRDYGAYLFFQFLTRTNTPDVIRGIWQATVDLPTSLDAVNAAVPGGFAKQWSEFSKRLWNRDPIDTRPDSFKVWDRLTDRPDVKLDISGDLGFFSREKSDPLDKEVNNLSTQYYRFTFSDPNTRSLLFYNGYFDQYTAGKAVKVLAIWKDGTGTWQEEDWSKYEFVGLCRDLINQRVSELVITISNGEFVAGGGGKLTATKAPYLKRNKLGCWKYEGTATSRFSDSTVRPSITSNLIWELNPVDTGLDVKKAFPNTLRAGLMTVVPLTGQNITVAGHATIDECTISWGPVTYPLHAGLFPPDQNILAINPFPELKTDDPILRGWLAHPEGAYFSFIWSPETITIASTISCPGFPDQHMPPQIEAILFTNLPTDPVSVSPPVASSNGVLDGTYVLFPEGDANWIFTWHLEPRSQ